MSSDFRRIISRAVNVPMHASDEVIAQALADAITGTRPSSTTAESTSTPPVDDPQADFEKLAKIYATTQGVSLSEAYARVSAECPTLYDRAVNRARLN